MKVIKVYNKPDESIAFLFRNELNEVFSLSQLEIEQIASLCLSRKAITAVYKEIMVNWEAMTNDGSGEKSL